MNIFHSLCFGVLLGILFAKWTVDREWKAKMKRWDEEREKAIEQVHKHYGNVMTQVEKEKHEL